MRGNWVLCPNYGICSATVYVQLGVGLNSEQRQRQNTDEFKCKLHLLTLGGLVNTTLYITTL